jgi:hypothetical protein
MAGVVAIPFPLNSSPGASAQESSGRLINCSAEPLEDKRTSYRRSAGMTQFGVTGQTGYRGAVLVKNQLYEAFKNRLIAVDTAGIITDIGALSGTLPVTMARNNLNPTPQVAIVTENGRSFRQGDPLRRAGLMLICRCQIRSSSRTAISSGRLAMAGLLHLISIRLRSTV